MIWGETLPIIERSKVNKAHKDKRSEKTCDSMLGRIQGLAGEKLGEKFFFENLGKKKQT